MNTSDLNLDNDGRTDMAKLRSLKERLASVRLAAEEAAGSIADPEHRHQAGVIADEIADMVLGLEKSLKP